MSVSVHVENTNNKLNSVTLVHLSVCSFEQMNTRFNIIRLSCNYITYIYVSITNLLRSFISVVFASTCSALNRIDGAHRVFLNLDFRT